MIGTENECYICRRFATERHHMLHGTANRKLADEDGLVVMLCRDCHRALHDKGTHDKDLMKDAERYWLACHRGDIKGWMDRYKKNYL